MKSKEEKIDAILNKYGTMVTGLSDLTADIPPSALFYLLADKLSYLLDESPEAVVTEKGVQCRRRLHFLIKTLGPHFLKNPQVFENRNFLRNPDIKDKIEPDDEIFLPKEPVMWTANHAFKDDTLATILAAKRHAYILFGSLPQFYNTFDGITAYLNGVIMTNRKVAASKKSSIAKAVRAVGYGADLMVFPEGVWNKTPNRLLLDLWPGIYRIACETGAKVIPVVHYMRDCTGREKNNPIHTVIEDPIRNDDLSEQAALRYVRDVLATWFYLMMEVYGKSTREKEVGAGISSTIAWEQELMARVKTADRYDQEIELCADYRPKDIVSPEQVWQVFAEIEEVTPQNAEYVAYARRLLEELRQQDFQRRF
ncbi:MAG: 1-acyl-sn-glycerol-3-phosphate acyltransferase [Bacteroidales bacterium]|nr:1-acyl-sn-glycerol-3-phosphate acyltransferase [Lachnoclostridium sp.]MCM1384709.1 1-acyl-sn-glycerol-3-phosphate acyltransferase [Lachnoclostridium sp.]MCM1465277.1 1-acyl-sn-glycerol-3-phosphate acyltransferase [Bacteroidales bacterium]